MISVDNKSGEPDKTIGADMRGDMKTAGDHMKIVSRFGLIFLCLAMFLTVAFAAHYKIETGKLLPPGILLGILLGAISWWMARAITARESSLHELSTKMNLYRTLIESSQNMVYIVDPEGLVIFANRNACTVLAPDREEITGQNLHHLLPGMWTDRLMENIHKVLRTRQVHFFQDQISFSNSAKWLDTQLVLIDNVIGTPGTVMCVSNDITERKWAEERLRESLEEKEILLKEIHHRVKNNLLAISGLINLQASYLADENLKNAFKSSQSRILSMAIVHEKLCQLKNVSRISFGDYLRTLMEHMAKYFSVDTENVGIEVICDGSELNPDTAIPCGLIVNELVSNSLKHAFCDGRKGIVRVEITRLPDEEFQLTVSDNGRGLPPNCDLDDFKTLGLSLVANLVDQLNGQMTIVRQDGTMFRIRFREYHECGIELY